MDTFKVSFTADHRKYQIALVLLLLLFPLAIYGTYRYSEQQITGEGETGENGTGENGTGENGTGEGETGEDGLYHLTFDAANVFSNYTNSVGDNDLIPSEGAAFEARMVTHSTLAGILAMCSEFIAFHNGEAEYDETLGVTPSMKEEFTLEGFLSQTPHQFNVSEPLYLYNFSFTVEETMYFDLPYYINSYINPIGSLFSSSYHAETPEPDSELVPPMEDLVADLLDLMDLIRFNHNTPFIVEQIIRNEQDSYEKIVFFHAELEQALL